ncbi:MAG: type IV toxin-antitoxin system AbiEi family antitoxin domain-containing protein [Pseudonocardiaceae bacterium]
MIYATDVAGYVTLTLTVIGMSDLFTTTQAAEVLGVSGRTLARYVERGWLRPTVVLPSGHFRWDIQEIHRQLEERRRRERE